MTHRPDSPALLARLTALGDMARLRILRLLDRHELSVGELSRALQLPQSTVSRHLKLLHDGAWIIKRSAGTASLYSLLDDHLEPEAHHLWHLARGQIGSGPPLDDDDSRLAGVLAERRADSREFFGRVGGDWDGLRHDLFGDQFTADALLALLPGAWTVADLGCGTGNVSELLAPCVQRIIAVDREPAMLEAARRRLDAYDNIDFRQGELTDLPIEDGALDAAVVFLVLHHLPEPGAAVAHIAGRLAPGGMLMILDMVAHDRESFLHTMGHQHLGFDEETVGGWAKDAGLRLVRYRRVRPDTHTKGPGLFVAVMERAS